jgi:hypothetical protein
VVVSHMDQVIPLALAQDLTVVGSENMADPLLDLLIAKKDEDGAETEAPAVH